MRVVIPSYNRPEAIQEKTLAYLLRSGYPAKDILVLVADTEQAFLYIGAFEADPYLRGIDIQITKKGLEASRAYARRTCLQPGEHVVWMDDDIEDILQLENEDGGLAHAPLAQVAQDGFATLSSSGLKMWGVAPSANAFYMDLRARQGLYFCIGCFYGEIIDPDPRLDVVFGDSKGDYERTLRHNDVFGGVIRLDWYAPKTRYRQNAGGVVADAAKVEENVRRLEQHWPEHVRRNEKRKSGVAEILLKSGRTATNVWR